jgi:hypothetical protein
MSLNRKGDEISVILEENIIRPHLICLSEHHMRKQDMSNFSLSCYKLATSFCRKKFLNRAVCILVRNDIIYHAVDLEKSCNGKSPEICAIKLNISSTNFIVMLCLQIPIWKCKPVFKTTGTLKGLYQPSVIFLICGDLNINFLLESLAKQKLQTIMKTSNPKQVVNFPTRIFNNKGTLIDSIFLDNMKYNSISVYPLENGLSDHDAQILVVENVELPPQKPAHKNKTWTVDVQIVAKFQMLLKEETWDTVYNADNVNRMFNNFHCILQRYFENSFPVSYKSYRTEHNNWITNVLKHHVRKK